ncbi:MAG TPA: VCBS repeat-containing protein, partial [Gemmatimonadales bacterium]|nr:VCBS repeat-containing protein [Gemmatimonadales bacterium]
MRSPLAARAKATRALVILAFVAVLAAPLAVRRLAPPTTAAAALSARAGALERYGFAFEEVSRAAGIRFAHRAPELDPRLRPIMPWVAAYGASVSVVDFDRDGWQDLHLTNSAVDSRNALYRNRGDGTFEDVAPRLGLADVNRRSTGVSMGAVWGDYDNDGYEDLFLFRWGRPELFHNEQGRG